MPDLLTHLLLGISLSIILRVETNEKAILILLGNDTFIDRSIMSMLCCRLIDGFRKWFI